MQTVTYKGSSDRSPLVVREAYELEQGGKTYTLLEGVAQDVPDDVAKAVAKAEGHKFDIGKKGE